MINIIENQRQFMIEITKELEELKIFLIGDVVKEECCGDRKAPNCLIDDIKDNNDRLEYILQLTNQIKEIINGGKR